MTTRSTGVPASESQLVMALALLRWSPRQFAAYAAALGHPVPLSVLEEAVRATASPLMADGAADDVAHLRATLDSLGLSCSPDGFGVVRRAAAPALRAPAGAPSAELANVLVQNFPQADIRAAVHGRARGERAVAVVFHAEFGTALLLKTGSGAEGAAVLDALYANALTRLSVVTEVLDDLDGLVHEVVLKRVASGTSMPAVSVSRGRMQQLLGGNA